MVKTPIYKEPMKTVGVKLPQSKIDEVPGNMKASTYFRGVILSGGGNELSFEHKSTVKSFYDLFMSLVLDGKIDDYITDDLIVKAEKLKEMTI